MKELSIIIPVYNVEKYILRCLSSIFFQGLPEKSFEVIVVNDGSNDKSEEIISNFAKHHDNILVINQNHKGVSIARNVGLTYASGLYILFVDSDDLLIENSLTVLLPKALESSVDMLIAGYVKMTDEEIEKVIPAYNENSRIKTIFLNGRKAFVDFFNPNQCYIWRTIYRRGFLEKKCLTFIPELFFEDILFTTECFLKVENTMTISLPFYVYRQHKNSIVSSVNRRKMLDLNIIIARLWSLFDTEISSKEDYKKMMDTVFKTFSIEMWYLSHEKDLYNYRKEIVSDLKSRIPNLYFSNGLKQRFISFLFKLVPSLYLWIHSLSIFKQRYPLCHNPFYRKSFRTFDRGNRKGFS